MTMRPGNWLPRAWRSLPTRRKLAPSPLQSDTPPQSSSSWPVQLRHIIAELEELNRTTEASFLAVGGKLMSFLSASRKLHADIEALTSLTSGEQTQSACEALLSVRQFAQTMREGSAGSNADLLTMAEASARIHREFSALPGIVFSFRTTAIVARIETAHLALDEKEFSNLAEEMQSCGDGIRTGADEALETAAKFGDIVANARKEISQINVIQQRELPTLLSEVDSDLAEFQAQQSETAEASNQLAALLNTVTAELGGIATALQFHDITRQRLEHIIEALNELLHKESSTQLSSMGAALVSLQNAQLRAATSGFTESTGKIAGDLEAVTSKVAEMAISSQKILGVDQGSDASFLDQMEQRFARVLDAITEAHSLSLTTKKVVSGLHMLVRQLRSSVLAVQTIEHNLSLVSLNAAVSACHLGTPGEPLNVVAGEMKALQRQCSSHSRIAETCLNDIANVLSSLAGRTTDDGKAVLADLKERVKGLKDANQGTSGATNDIAGLATSLRGNLGEVHDEFQAAHAFAERMNRCAQLLEALVTELGASHSLSDPSLQEALAQRYTMQAERDIHLGNTSLETSSISDENEAEFF